MTVHLKNDAFTKHFSVQNRPTERPKHVRVHVERSRCCNSTEQQIANSQVENENRLTVLQLFAEQYGADDCEVRQEATSGDDSVQDAHDSQFHLAACEKCMIFFDLIHKKNPPL